MKKIGPGVSKICLCRYAGGCTCSGVPAGGCTCQGVYLPGGVPACRGCTCLWMGVPTGGCTCLGVYLPGGCTCPGGVPAQGMYLPGGSCPGGVSAWGGVYLLGGVSQHALRQTPTHCKKNDSTTPVKILPCRNFVADGNSSRNVLGDLPTEGFCLQEGVCLQEGICLQRATPNPPPL